MSCVLNVKNVFPTATNKLYINLMEINQVVETMLNVLGLIALGVIVKNVAILWEDFTQQIAFIVMVNSKRQYY